MFFVSVQKLNRSFAHNIYMYGLYIENGVGSNCVPHRLKITVYNASIVRAEPSQLNM